MTDNLYQVSDGLFQLRRALVSHEATGVTLSAEQVQLMNRVLFLFGQSALKQAHEISRHRWNAAARADHGSEDRVLEEAMRPGTNLFLLANVGRDGLPGASA
ncbi:hypothetical protein ASD64_07250 [Mesorhizobium sp. Root157]|uniref:hypothetical protein n=1 Tax=Mesorhizobium sp. Root157 TaxID=1736477 RepID=UPI0006FF7194|nr:hypothetical protein [Mesorhizobium sp. Root157]KQZ87227.1 hypothetical protein ASD64_07250 [Mesorhizobium sp. Root157]